MKVHQAVAHAIAQTDVNPVFGLMGDANMLILTSLMGDEGVRFVGASHEAGAVAMAVGFSRVSGGLAIASVTHGPAFTNTLTALVEAARWRSSVLLLTGDPPSVRDHLQYIDIPTLVAATGAGYERVYSAETTVDDFNRAVWRVHSERRPIVLNVPFDLLTADAGEPGPLRATAQLPPPSSASEGSLDAALGLIASARRPLLLAGRGAVDANAPEALVALGDLIDAPMATTLGAKDLFRAHPRNIGVFGTVSSSPALELIGESDCIVAFGASLNQYTTAQGALIREKRVVQVDSDPSQIARRYPVDVPVVGDAREVAERISVCLREADLGPARSDGLAHAGARWAEAARADAFDDQSGAQTIDLRTAMVALDEALPAARSVVTDVGRFMIAPWQHLHVPDPRYFLPSVGFGSIGLGLGTAIGASFAAPEQMTVLVTGDAGFMMSVGELATAARNRLPLTVVVANDGAYGAEYRKLKEYGVDPAYSLLVWPDLAELARGFGCEGVTVKARGDLKLARDRFSQLEGPLLVDLRLDPALEVFK